MMPGSSGSGVARAGVTVVRSSRAAVVSRIIESPLRTCPTILPFAGSRPARMAGEALYLRNDQCADGLEVEPDRVVQVLGRGVKGGLARRDRARRLGACPAGAVHGQLLVRRYCHLPGDDRRIWRSTRFMAGTAPVSTASAKSLTSSLKSLGGASRAVYNLSTWATLRASARRSWPRDI